MYNIFLDDEREVKDVTWVSLPPGNWVVVRNYNDFVKTIQKNGLPANISFDHDLGVVGSDKEMGGTECAKWLVQYCIDNGLDLPRYTIHSKNPIGIDRIYNSLKDFDRYKNR